jgi:hypothetical protein
MNKRLFIDIVESVQKGEALAVESFLNEIEDVLSKNGIIKEYGLEAIAEAQLSEFYGEEVLQEAIESDEEFNEIYQALSEGN